MSIRRRRAVHTDSWRLTATTVALALLVSISNPIVAAAAVFIGELSRSTVGDGLVVAAGNGAGTLIALDAGQLFRSLDGGRTWSDPQAYPGGTLLYLPNGSLLRAQGCTASLSIDDGQTWAMPTPMYAAVGSCLTVALHASAMAVRALLRTEDGLELVESTDGGAAWSYRHRLAVNPAEANGFPHELVTSWDGRWVVSWIPAECTNDSDDVVILHSRSTDDGLTWSDPLPLPSGGGTPATVDTCGLLFSACSRAGTCLIAWRSLVEVPGGSVRSDLFFVRSPDAGATWSAAAPLSPTALEPGSPAPYFSLGFVTDNQGTWLASSRFSTGPGPVFPMFGQAHYQSVDDGRHWSSPAFFDVKGLATRYSYPGSGGLFMDDGGFGQVWALRYQSDGQPNAPPPLLIGRNVRPVCPAAPATGCVTSPQPRSSMILFDGNVHYARNRMAWRNAMPEETMDAFGEPDRSEGYAFCVYRHDTDTTRVAAAYEIPGNAQCAGRPCWKRKRQGWQFRDNDHEHTSIRRATFRIKGTDALISLDSYRASLMIPPLPLSAPGGITAQLVDLGSGRCWAADYTAATDSTNSLFRAFSD